MKVASEIMEVWNSQKEHGDGAEFERETGKSQITFFNAMKTGRMNNATYKAMKEFFKNKAEKKAKEIKEIVGSNERAA